MIQPFEVRHILTNFLCIKFALDWLSFLFYSFWKLYCIWSLSFKCRFKLTLKSQNLVLKLIYWIYSFESESCNNHSAHYAILILKDPDVLYFYLTSSYPHHSGPRVIYCHITTSTTYVYLVRRDVILWSQPLYQTSFRGSVHVYVSYRGK